MRKFVFPLVLTWALAALLLPTTYAETDSTNAAGTTDYRVPINDALELETEASGHKVYLKWSTFEGYRDEEFEYYKVVRSYSNPNPVYPEDDGIAYFDGLGELRYTDENATKGAYYRICAITDVKGRYCSNVVWVEIDSNDDDHEDDTDCKDWSSTGECEMTYDEYEAEKKAEDEEWEHKQDEAKKRLEEKKEAEREEWERKQDEKREEWERKKEDHEKEMEEKKADMEQQREDRKEEIWKRLYEKLDAWLEKFAQRLEGSDLTNAAKVEKIEQIQQRFYNWEEGNEMRMRIVDHLDEQLNEWKQKYSQDEDFSDVENFLDGLLD